MANPWIDLPASVRVRDGNDQLVFLGQQTMANSWPVVIASNQTAIPVSVSSLGAVAATIADLSVPLANTEVSYAFPSKTAKFSIRSRTPSRIQFSFVATQSGTTFFTVVPGGVWSEDNLDLTGITLYLQTNLASQTIEILTWQHS